MIRPTLKTIHWLMALLLAAQLCSVAHAAEYGSGLHSHDEIVCPYALGNDDDVSTVQSGELLHQWVIAQNGTPVLSSDPTASLPLRPPATGPPIL